MTWEDVLSNVIPLALIGLGGLVLKLWRSQAVTDVVIDQLKKDAAEVKEDMKGFTKEVKVLTTDSGKIVANVSLLTQAFDNFVLKNGGH